MLARLLEWPLVRQILEGKDGTGVEAMSERTRAMHARIDDAQVARSICPYCGVGCGQLIYHKDGKLVSIEGDPESPISQGNLCPKGAASYQLLTHVATRNEDEIPRTAHSGVAGDSSGTRDGHGRGPCLGIAETDICQGGRGLSRQSHDGDLPSRRRHAR